MLVFWEGERKEKHTIGVKKQASHSMGALQWWPHVGWILLTGSILKIHFTLCTPRSSIKCSNNNECTLQGKGFVVVVTLIPTGPHIKSLLKVRSVLGVTAGGRQITGVWNVRCYWLRIRIWKEREVTKQKLLPSIDYIVDNQRQVFLDTKSLGLQIWIVKLRQYNSSKTYAAKAISGWDIW